MHSPQLGAVARYAGVGAGGVVLGNLPEWPFGNG